jgi:hypothetical protein
VFGELVLLPLFTGPFCGEDGLLGAVCPLVTLFVVPGMSTVGAPLVPDVGLCCPYIPPPISAGITKFGGATF